MQTMGERLCSVRKKKGYTQGSLGDAIGVSRGVIFNIEKNLTEPQTIVINALCQTLNLNKEWLINGTGEMAADADKESPSALLLQELYTVAKELSDEERLFLLDVMKAMQDRLTKNKDLSSIG